MRKFLKDNRGVSLIELIVVTSILIVLAGTAAFSIRMVVNRSATQCAQNMKVSLEKHRTAVMGKKNGRIAFYSDANGNIYVQEEFDYTSTVFVKNTANATKIGRNNVEVTCGGVAISSTPVVFEFTRSGSLKEGSANVPIVIKRFSKEYTLTIDSLTGKITLK